MPTIVRSLRDLRSLVPQPTTDPHRRVVRTAGIPLLPIPCSHCIDSVNYHEAVQVHGPDVFGYAHVKCDPRNVLLMRERDERIARGVERNARRDGHEAAVARRTGYGLA